jgi:energy-coupling factor transporter ATP-binding protein EcfA2
VAGKEFQVLNNVCGKVEQKSMVALMGGSGAGKTSLLNTLCGRAFYATKISGELRINGQIDKMENYQDIIGFVPQDDIVHPDLTVYVKRPGGDPFAHPNRTDADSSFALAGTRISSTRAGSACPRTSPTRTSRTSRTRPSRSSRCHTCATASSETLTSAASPAGSGRG